MTLESALLVTRYVEVGAISKHMQALPGPWMYESSHSQIFITDIPNHYLMGLIVEKIRLKLAKENFSNPHSLSHDNLGLVYKHWEYQAFTKVQVYPLAHTVGPVQPLPPH